jgi:hypothetical protein
VTRLIVGSTAVLLALSGGVQAAGPAITAVRIAEPIVLDGALDDAPWRLAVPVSDFVQSEPRQGERASEATEVRVLVDAQNLYFGVTCFDRDPHGIRSNSLRVDFSPADEDIFQIILDPFASSRDGFLFIINPYGAKRDEQISNEGRESNVSWDAEWDVRTAWLSDGWSAEIRIPLRSLRYERGQARPWKVNFGRQIRRNNEEVYWAQIPRQLEITQLSLAGELVGLDLDQLGPGRNLLVTPYVVANRVTSNDISDNAGDFGADLKFGLTPGLTLDVTYNTDFSHVEVDQQQVNLDRFRLSFPERRDFFLENEGIFQIGSVRVQAMSDAEDPAVFYSRNIGLSLAGRPVPILGGARLSGRVGSYALGLMSIQTEEGDDQGPENATVMRVRRDVLRRSWIGGFLLNRDGPERVGNRVFGVDGLFRPSNDLTVTSYFSQSQTPDVSGNDWTLRVESFYNSRRWHLLLTHANIQPDYRDDLGFVPRRGVVANRIEARPRFRPWQGGPVREFQPVLNIRYTEDSDYDLLSREQAMGFDMYFRDGAFLRFRRRQYFERLDEDFAIRPGIVIGTGGYRFDEQGLEYNTDRSRRLAISAKAYTGTFWDGRKVSWEASADYRPSAHLGASFGISRNDVDLPGGDFTTNLVRLRLQYAFNTRLFLDTFIQYNNERDEVTSNVRFNWIHRPLSDLFLVYTEERATRGPVPVDHVISIKYTRLFSF